MKVQILHHRDPDYDCSIDVYIDGVRVTDVEIEDIDPGRGYDEDEIADRRENALKRANTPGSTAYDADVAAALNDARFERFGL